MKTLQTLLFLCLFIAVEAQTNFLPGYIITNEGDTLKGLIDYRSDARNARKCEFRQNSEAPLQEFLPFSIQGYRFNDGKYYVSREVTVEGQPTPLFIEYLLNGISDLYYYNNGLSYHYYIEKADGKLFELTNEEKEVSVNNRIYRKNSKMYIGALKYAFADAGQLTPLINNAKLEHKSLINITKKYHDQVCDDYQCIVYERKLPAVRLKLGVSAILNNSFARFSNNPKLEVIDFGITSYPALEVVLNNSMPRASEKLSVQLSGEFSNPHFQGTGYLNGNAASYQAEKASLEELDIRTFLIKTRAGLKYTWPKGKYRPSFLVGGHYTFLGGTKARHTEKVRYNSVEYATVSTDVPVPNAVLGLNADLGIEYVSHPTRTPFLKLGYETGLGNKVFIFSSHDSFHLNTIKIQAGIYF